MEEHKDIGAYYPDIYKRMEPYAAEAVRLYGEEPFGEDALGRMTKYVVSKSNFLRDPPPAWHNERPIDELARWLILNNLWGYYGDGYYDDGYPYYYPAYPWPIFYGGGGAGAAVFTAEAFGAAADFAAGAEDSIRGDFVHFLAGQESRMASIRSCLPVCPSLRTLCAPTKRDFCSHKNRSDF
ncbi:hypothetical protein FACS1894211_09190 [Clostridia bacterium]|nr:hypothetical protein FACS1894211_09190 [Clostridia bacterium]